MIKLETEKILSLRINVFHWFSWNEIRLKLIIFLGNKFRKKDAVALRKAQTPPVLPSVACSFWHSTALQFSWCYSIAHTQN